MIKVENSSNVTGYEYICRLGVLVVAFTGGSYRYDDVSPEAYREMVRVHRTGKSVGGFVANVLKKVHKAAKVTPEEIARLHEESKAAITDAEWARLTVCKDGHQIDLNEPGLQLDGSHATSCPDHPTFSQAFANLERQYDDAPDSATRRLVRAEMEVL